MGYYTVMKIVSVFFLLLYFSFPVFTQQEKKLSAHFAFNEFALNEKDKAVIDSALANITVKKIIISAHCDSIGNNDYNDRLSEKRSGAVKEYFLEKNIPAEMICTKGFGKREPLNENKDENERALNRRAEISIEYEVKGKKEEKTPDKFFVKKDSAGSYVPIKQNNTDTSMQINVSNMEVGGTLVLKNLNFAGGRAVLLSKSYPVLKELLKILQENPTLVIEIDGHICCLKGGDGFDMDTGSNTLSLDRAEAVYNYLVKHGIDKDRLSYKGFGADNKLVKEEITEEDRSQNRRVEIKI